MVGLGGSLDTEVSAARGDLAMNEAAERLTKTLELARRFPDAKIIFSGGHGELRARGPSEAALAARWLEDLGVTPGRVLVEDRSRDTAENASLSKRLASPSPGQHWLLLTSAHH